MSEPSSADIGMILAYCLRRDMVTQANAGLSTLALTPLAHDLTAAYREMLRQERESDLRRLEADTARAIIADNRAKLADIRLKLLDAESQEERESLLADARQIAGEIQALADALDETEHTFY